MKNVQTLHCHTTTSDGDLTHFQLLDLCLKLGIKAIAFTDHDSLPNSQTAHSLMKNKNNGVKWIIGVEVNSGWPKEIGNEMGSGFDIVGLFTDPTNKALVEHCQKAQAARVSRMSRIVKGLNQIGFKISADDCLKASGGEALGRPHIVKAIRTHPSNLELIEKLGQKMEEEAKNDGNLKEKYDQMVRQGEDQYPYVLFLSENSFIPNKNLKYDYWLDMDSVVNLIRRAGGLAFLAHYFTVKKTLTPDILEKIIKEKRLDGLETVFGVYDKSTGITYNQLVVESRMITKNLVKKYHCLESGGNDAHTEQSLIDFVNNEEFSKDTVGLAERIIKQSKINTAWSSF